MKRTEKDFIAEIEIPEDALYGIHSVRAKNNFPDTTPFHKEWYEAIGLVKLACYTTYRSFREAILSKYSEKTIPLKLIDFDIIQALEQAAIEVSEGRHFDHFIVPAISGGAVTSINMNVNEIISNLALISLGKLPGDYTHIDPIETANIYQSTNDVIPTSLKLSVIKLLNELEISINTLRAQVEAHETKHRNHLRIAYTQMQEAVPSSFGKLFSTYSDALSRDWWRISKCFERIKVVNLGGSAIGTGIAVPRFFIMEVCQELQKISKLPITRSENLSDATNNLDSFVEVHAIIKSHAVNLEKIVNDIRLLSSDLMNQKELNISQIQLGSSIMPGKVNPVIPEYVISIAHKVYANDQLISSLCAQGCLDLNAYLPVIGNAIIDSLKLLITADNTLVENLFAGMTVNSEIAQEKLFNSPAITTALTPYVGYNKAAELAKLMKENGIDIFEANEKLQFIEQEKLISILKPENLLKSGFSIEDIID